VAFDPSKESIHVLSKSSAEGQNFLLLGINFDCSLDMTDAINDVVTEAGWKMRTLLRTRRFYCNADLVILYKSHLLSYLEYRTPAIYHARREQLKRLDNVQDRFLHDAGIEADTALLEFNLAPLCTRRDIAMLGLIHRAVLGLGPPHFRKHFRLEGTGAGRHRRHLVDPRPVYRAHIVSRSALGLIAVYNLLPEGVVAARDVSAFQCALQQLVKSRCRHGCADWVESLSPRVPLATHPLR
jgi:hypothetical protein